MSVQPSPPSPAGSNAKAYAAVVAGALATIVVYVIDQITKSPMPPEIVAAVQTLVTAALVWFVPHNLGSN